MHDDGDEVVRTEDCPKCEGKGTVVVRPWWDDAPENGGQCIGEWLQCIRPSCDFTEDH
jgi:hypothetical protein